MKYISVEELKSLINGKELVYTLENLLLDDGIVIYDEKKGKEIWVIQNYDDLHDGLDIINEKLKEYDDKILVLEYYYRWSRAQFYFCNDRLHQVKVKIYLNPSGIYEIEEFYDDGLYEIRTVSDEKELINRMRDHGYGRVLFITYISEELLPSQVMDWIKERGSWAKILVKETA